MIIVNGVTEGVELPELSGVIKGAGKAADDAIDVRASEQAGRLLTRAGKNVMPDDYVTVYHATDAETASRLLKQGVVPGAKVQRPPTIIEDETVAKMLKKKVGDPLDFEPGRGSGSGFYVGADPTRLSQYGDVVLAIRVRAKDIGIPSERATRRMTPGKALLLDDGYIEAGIPKEALSLHTGEVAGSPPMSLQAVDYVIPTIG